MKHIAKYFLALVVLAASTQALAQNELIVSQYIHNRFAVNPSFAGARGGLSVFGGFRKQWATIENTPRSILLTAHSPLKNEKLTLGLSLYNQKIHECSRRQATALALPKTHGSVSPCNLASLSAAPIGAKSGPWNQTMPSSLKRKNRPLHS